MACEKDVEEVKKAATHVISIPNTKELLPQILEIVPLQLRAFLSAGAATSTSRATPPRALLPSKSEAGRALADRRHARKGCYEYTSEVASWTASHSLPGAGLLTVFIQHTSASLPMQENVHPDVVYDLERFFSRVAPEDNRLYRYTIEGRMACRPTFARRSRRRTWRSRWWTDNWRSARGRAFMFFEHRAPAPSPTPRVAFAV